MELNNKDCKNCPLFELRNCQPLNGIGNLQSKIVFVFDAPSAEDDATGKSFSGQVARKLDGLLSKFGIHRSQVFMTYATRCRGNLRTEEGFRPPHFEEVQACNEYLLAEINQIKPNIIVTFGNEALWAITGNKKDKIGIFRGKEIWSQKFNCKVLPTFSMGKILRDPNSEEIVSCDIERAIESSKSLEMTKIQEGNYIVLDTLEKFDSFIERMKEVTECAIDLETSGFNWQKDKIMCCSFSFAKGTGVLLPITRWVGYERDKIELKDKKIRRKGQTEIKKVEVLTKETVDQYEPWWKENQEYIMSKFKELMERDDIDWIGQNLKFDWKFFLQMGWKSAPAAYDTLLMHYLLYETAKGQRKLGMLSLNFLGKGQHKQEIENWFIANGMADEDDRHYARVPEALLYKYGTVDSDDTFQLKQIFYRMIEEQGMVDLLKKLIMPLNYTLTIAEFDGYKIDMKWLNRAKEKIKKQLENIQAEIVASVGEINVASNKQLPKLLYETLKLPIVKQTPKGAPSTDEETLKILMENHPHPILAKILEYRGLAKLLGTYIEGIEDKIDDKGRLHAHFLIEGTECVTPDTYLWSDKGLIQPKDFMGDFPSPKQFKKYGLKLVNMLGKLEESSHLYNGGKRNLIKIKTSLGIELKATPEHPLLVLKDQNLEWVKTKDLKLGDLVQVNLGNKIWGSSNKLQPSTYIKKTSAKKIKFPDKLTPDLCRFVGYWIAEGCFIQSKNEGRFGIQITNKDPSIIKDIMKISNKIFGIKPFLYCDKRNGVQTTEYISKELYEWWIKNFGYQHGAKNKYTPAIIKQTTWRNIREFLRGLTTDACVGVYRVTKTSKPQPYLKFVSDSQVLMKEVQQFLLNFGFRAKFYKAKKYKDIKKTAVGGYFTSCNYQVCLDGKEVLRFINECPLVVTIHKQRIKSYTPERHIEFKLLKKNKYVRLFRNKWFVSVNKKIPYYAQQVVDFIMPETHSFVTNGLVSHNTGRLSSQGPNLQNIPRDSKDIKGMYTVEKGNVLTESDMAQNEFRWWGILSNDPQLVKDLNDGLDIHTFMAAQANKISMEEVTLGPTGQRQKAKSIVFGTMFGEGPEDLAKKHGVTVVYAMEIQNIFFNRYPTAKQWKYEMIKFARKNLYVRNRFGRVRHVPVINHSDNKISWGEQQASVNSPIQGSASDYVSNAANRIMLRFKELGLRGKLLNLVHDAIYMEIPKTELKQSLQIMDEEMTRRILGIQVPLIAEHKIGLRWSRMHKIGVK